MAASSGRNWGVALLRSAVFRIGFAGIAASGLAAAGCYGNPHDFHPGWSNGQGGSTSGQGGATTGGQGGADGVNSMNMPGVTTVCSPTAPTAFAVEWTLEDKSSHPVTCTAIGGATVDLDVLNLATSAATHDTFPCDAMAGTGSMLDPGNYTVAVRLYDANGVNLSEAVAAGMYTITSGCTVDLGLATFPSPVTTPDQYITLSWAIDRKSTGDLLSCADAQASSVELDADDMTFQWPCTNRKAATKSLAPATYDVKIKLLDATGTVLSITPSMPVTVTAGQAQALGNVVFDVN
jgi:hypothetical protein